MSLPRLHFLGTGTAFNTDGRGSQAILVDPGSHSPVLVDIGPTLMAAAQRYRCDLSRVGRLFLTHLHGDHVAGWPFLLLHMHFQHQRRAPLEIFGPTGTRACLEGLSNHCYGNLLASPSFEVRYHEIPIRRAAEIPAGPGLSLGVEPMEHHPTSLGLLLGFDGSTIGVSGDTAWCEGLVALAAASDLLVLECSSVTPQPGAHLSLKELRVKRARLDVAQILLVHLTDAVAEALARDPLPGVLSSYDGYVYPETKTE